MIASRHCGHNGHVPVGCGILQDLGVDLSDLSYKAQFRIQLVRFQQGTIQTAQAHSFATGILQALDQILIDLARQHLLNNVHSLLVGDPHAIQELSLFADLFQHAVDLRPAAVDQHHVDAYQLHQNDVVHDVVFQILVNHGIAAIFHHNGFTRVFFDIGQGLYQNLGPLAV